MGTALRMVSGLQTCYSDYVTISFRKGTLPDDSAPVKPGVPWSSLSATNCAGRMGTALYDSDKSVQISENANHTG